MFAQDLRNDIPTILVRGDIRSIEFHKYSLFNFQYSFPASPVWVIAHWVGRTFPGPPLQVVVQYRKSEVDMNCSEFKFSI